MMGKYSIKNSGSSSYDSTSSSSTVHLLRKAKNKERDDNEDLATIIRYLVDNQNPRNTKYTNIKSTEVILTGRNNYKLWSDTMVMVLRLSHVEEYIKKRTNKKN